MDIGLCWHLPPSCSHLLIPTCLPACVLLIHVTPLSITVMSPHDPIHDTRRGASATRADIKHSLDKFRKILLNRWRYAPEQTQTLSSSLAPSFVLALCLYAALGFHPPWMRTDVQRSVPFHVSKRQCSARACSMPMSPADRGLSFDDARIQESKSPGASFDPGIEE